jgi:type IV pilus assembly protein PilV
MRAVMSVERRGGSRWHPRELQKCAGMAMVEALVAVLVVAIGLMGVASLIVESVRNGHGALLRTQAVNLVSDMVERIRANPLGTDAYDCSRYSAAPALLGCSPSGAAPGGVSCTARELAEDDLAEWQSAVRRVLPSVASSSCGGNVSYVAASDAAEPSRYLVSVSWQQRGEPLTYQSELLVAAPAAH